MWPWACAELFFISLFLQSTVAFVATRLSGTPFHSIKDRNYVAHQFRQHVFERDDHQKSCINCGAAAGTDVGLGARPHLLLGDHHY